MMKDEANRELSIILPGKRLRVRGLTYYMRNGQFMTCASQRRNHNKRTEAKLPLERMEMETPLHLYLFFGTEDGTRFSPSVYAKVCQL